MSKGEQPGLADALRRGIAESGVTAYRLGQESGVDRSQLSRFLRGERDLSLAVAGKLCAALGLGLVRVGPPRVTPSAEGEPEAPPEPKKPRGRGKAK